VIAAAALAASLAGAGTIRTLLVVSVCGLLWLRWTRNRSGPPNGSQRTGTAVTIAAVAACGTTRAARAGGPYLLGAATGGIAASAATPVSIWQLALFFLKVGAVLYGTGYVLIAYLEGGLVDQYQWLTRDQLLDAFAVGNLTPGPILSTATFIGFVLLATPDQTAPGLIGAAVATIAIFLPSFFFVAVLGPIIPRLRQSRWAAAFLDAVNAASIGLIAAVTIKLCLEIFVVPPESAATVRLQWAACAIAAAAAAAHFRYRVATVWLVIGGAFAGWLFSLLRLV
jgi:chromate transporter